MNPVRCKCNPARALALAAVLLLSACASRFENVAPADPDWERHQQEILALSDWELSGRLNVRQNGQSETVLINWGQQDENFSLHLSGSFGLGAVHAHGTPRLITVEKSGEDTVTLRGLAALTREYFGYDFPAAQLLYWVRGIPAPDLPASTTLDQNLMLGTLEQSDPAGQRWTLNFDRYMASGAVYLPGRIRVQREGLQLIFLISDWQIPDNNTRP